MTPVDQTKGHIIEQLLFQHSLTSVGVLRLKVHGIMYTKNAGTGYSIKKRIPPHLLITMEERLKSIGTQLKILECEIREQD